MKDFNFTLDGENITVIITRHANTRIKERKINEYGVFGAIVSLGENILDYKPGDEFAIIDEDLNIAIICNINCSVSEGIYIDVITVIDKSKIYVKKGTKIYKLHEIEKNN